MTTDRWEPLGTLEVAEMVGVKPNTLAKRVSRGTFPRPRWRVNGGATLLWALQDIRDELVRTGRLPLTPVPPS